VARYNFITPNLCDDGHDSCSPTNDPVKQTDTWLSTEVPKILNSSAYKNGGALFITWDEGEGGDGPIGMMVLSPLAKGNGYANSIHYTHSSTLRTMEEIFGVSPMLGDAQNATDLSDLFIAGAIGSTSGPTPTPGTSSSGSFKVQGTQILDPSGHPFRIKGVDAVYGRFGGGDANGYGLTNYNNAQHDLDFLKSQGINLIRLSVSYDAAHLPSNDPNYIGGYTEYLTELDNVVSWITQRGMVVELSQGNTASFSNALSFVGTLAARYKSNNLVWIKPDNEPNCESGNGNSAYCYDWSTWQTQESQYVQTIRTNGNTNPIVVNCIDWSWDCSQIASYPLQDSLQAIVYGAHRYNNGKKSFDSADQSDCDSKWANLTTQFPMIVDEIGADDGYPISLTWNQGFMDYATNWTLTRGGDGVIGFVGHWSDGNDMYDGSPPAWTPWGSIFSSSFLQKT
jgi:hypothetical protein